MVNGQSVYLSWIIPAYNEVQRIEKTIREVDLYLRAKNFEYEIVVVDNASRDDTSGVVGRVSRELPRLRLLRTQGPGKGWAVKEGMLNAAGEIRVFADADNSVSPEQANAFLEFICSAERPSQCYDVVVGSIEVPGAQIQENAQWYRRLLGKFSKYVIRAVAGLWQIRDTQRGFKFFSRRAAEIIFPRLTITTWGFDIEVLLIAKRHGLRVKELPVRWINPSDSKVGLGAYVTTFSELIKIKWNDLKGRYV